jgi:tRNA dimethylallyltransferase
MKKVLILLGPTGVGKTGASILLAQALKTEIISADSMQIYRGMDIGTAKPTIEERAGIRHHMIDIVDPSESYSTGQYVETIIPIIEGILKKGKIPIIVGGTGLYIKALTKGIFSGPSADWTLREDLLSLERKEKGSLYGYLVQLDPDAADKIERNDIRRMVRALEVCIRSGKKISSLRERFTEPLPYAFIKMGLTRERKELYRLIDARADDMIQRGLQEEAAKILSMNPDRTPLQAIGYKEFISHLKGEITNDEAVRLVKRNSRRYAKRQFTWFKKEEGITWADITGMFESVWIYQAMRAILERSYPEVFEDRTDNSRANMHA